MNEDVITVVGRLGGDPTLKSVHGDRVAEFRLGSTARRKEGETWVDGSTNWYSVEAWGDIAQHIVTSLRKGDLVVVLGRLKVEQWESGERRGTSVKIRADHLGHSLRSGPVVKDRRAREHDPADRASSAPGPDADREPDLAPAMAFAGEASGSRTAAGGGSEQAWSAPLSEPETPF
jgi:single-strand DNA-binding protein